MTQDEVRALFDYRDGQLFRKTRPSTNCREGERAGGLTAGKKYRAVRIDGVRHLEHRIIFLWHHGWLPKGDIDHDNKNKTDNRIENLRAATRSENQHNVPLQKNSTTGCKNVTQHYGKYRVRLSADGKDRFFGHFNDLELADLVAQEARDLYHGKFACHG